MLKSILVTALRNILRNRTFSLINLTGFAVSMSLGLLILMVVREQYTYDTFHQDVDKIYRVNTRALRVTGGTESYASTPMPIATVMRDDYSFAEQVVTLRRGLNGDAIYGQVNVPIGGLFADPNFFDLFNFPLASGNPANALVEPNSLVLTQGAAKKIFGTKDPLGQAVTLKGYGEFIVTGVMEEFKSKTHLEFEILCSTSIIPVLEKSGVIGQSTDNWNNYYSTYNYFKLKEGRETDEVDQALAAVAKKNYANLKLESRDKGYEFFLLRLDKLTPGENLSNQMGRGIPMLLVIFLSVLSGLIMIMACFNYTNLMIAKSLSRAREIGVRKVVGAQRIQVFGQFVGEAVVFALIALAFSYGLLQLLKPTFLQLNIALEFETELKEDAMLYVYFVSFAAAVGALAGLLPAAYLSAFKAASVLKDAGNLTVYSRLTLRKGLIVAQFTLSLMFIIFVIVVYRQVDYMLSKDYGLNDKDILNVRLQGVPYEKLANQARLLPGVLRVGGVSHKLGTWSDRSDDYRRNFEDKPFEMRDFVVDENYIENLQMVFVAGKTFNPLAEGQRESQVILNERALKTFNFLDPASAVGQSIYAGDSLQLTVIGVVRNFHFRPLSYEIGPLALRYSNNRSLGYMSMAIAPGQKEEVVAALEPVWRKIDPVHPLQWKMMADEIDDAYIESGFMDVLKMVGYVAFLAITLACLGMLGMAMYSTRTRIKEIGIRKVMGATSAQITVLLSRGFLLLIGISAILGAPMGYFLGEFFLQSYAYRIAISPLLMLSGIMGIATLGLITIGSQTWRAAASNPVESLRYE